MSADRLPNDGFGRFEMATATSWVGNLRFQDLQLLRAVVKKVHLRHLPGFLYSDREADKLIEALGPQVAEKMLKKAIDRGI